VQGRKKGRDESGLPLRLSLDYMPDLTAAFSWLPDENFGTRVAAI
jgi:hypothetical protein